ncbi:Mitochondrial cardiolipin hydrolase-like Protein [Tribolium castaneum]|uniref:Mitochondrial cardiolipin hydrolase n=1 Tax=Tribolium castaneum TaxID=7070 RepID=D7EKM6_TRICA|nr:PREDICTED: mitochondrial cardiolipin hydrolase [Tribolium castaneum]EFA13216.1 Mitochondrial cardiolipin hydrolase-like Protein [Tribolium castaneum]|eukprot:XP_008193743.1 PREDICTED: mitochondrial cardiolipin hydrolase [Tribolium castaneum]
MSLTNYETAFTAILFVPCVYMFKKLYSTYKSLKQQYEDEELFYQRHNCVVMYSKTHITGWPPEYKMSISTKNLDKFLDPYLYFINTSKHSIDLAVMTFSLKPLMEALQSALTRGVKVRLIVNYLSVKNQAKQYNELMKSGIKVAFYIEKTTSLSNIMHCKYSVKDYDGSKGFLFMGSMNLTGMSTILNNYEDVTFTSNIYLVETFHKSFQDSWNMIMEDNENFYNKTVLADSGFSV